MAYISTEEVKVIRDNLKKEFPTWKFSVTRHHSSSVNVAVMSSPYAFQVKYEQVNHYWMEESMANLSDDTQALADFQKIKDIITKEWYDNSDAQSDYFDTAFYYDINIGKWDKPYSKA